MRTSGGHVDWHRARQVDLSLEVLPSAAEGVWDLPWIEAAEPAPDDPAVELGAEEHEAAAERGEAIAEAVRDAFEQALAHEAAQVVGHLARTVGRAQEVLDERTQGSRADVAGRPAKVSQGAEEGHHARIAEAQPRGPALGWPGGSDERLERRGHRDAALGLALQRQEPAVDRLPDRDEGRQVRQPPADPEVVGVVDDGLGAQRPIELPVLLDAGVAVLDLQRWLGPGAEDAGPEGRPPVAQDAVEVIRATQGG